MATRIMGRSRDDVIEVLAASANVPTRLLTFDFPASLRSEDDDAFFAEMQRRMQAVKILHERGQLKLRGQIARAGKKRRKVPL